MTYQCKSPVLFLVFNRPELTARVFEAIRQARPDQLYVAADGPRADRAGEAQRCQQVRDIATAVDWDCEVHTLFREGNLGCGQAVSQAITWFFENVEEGIILEDDCLPHPSFFRYCDELLERCRYDDRIHHIGGTNPLNESASSSNYYYSKYNRIWGWATWSSSWSNFDINITDWPVLKKKSLLLSYFNFQESKFWSQIFDSCHSGKIDTWDYQWFLCRLKIGLGVVPGCNLVSNIGFGKDATHTLDASNELGQLKLCELIFPLTEPSSYLPDYSHDFAWSSKIVPSKMKGLIFLIKKVVKIILGRRK